MEAALCYIFREAEKRFYKVLTGLAHKKTVLLRRLSKQDGV